MIMASFIEKEPDFDNASHKVFCEKQPPFLELVPDIGLPDEVFEVPFIYLTLQSTLGVKVDVTAVFGKIELQYESEEARLARIYEKKAEL
jgi:hypothetical protein